MDELRRGPVPDAVVGEIRSEGLGDAEPLAEGPRRRAAPAPVPRAAIAHTRPGASHVARAPESGATRSGIRFDVHDVDLRGTLRIAAPHDQRPGHVDARPPRPA